jgi:hypothetical protein
MLDLRGPYTINHVAQHCVLCKMIDRVWCWLTWSWIGKLVLRKTILHNMIDRVWAALHHAQSQTTTPSVLYTPLQGGHRNCQMMEKLGDGRTDIGLRFVTGAIHYLAALRTMELVHPAARRHCSTTLDRQEGEDNWNRRTARSVCSWGPALSSVNPRYTGRDSAIKRQIDTPEPDRPTLRSSIACSLSSVPSSIFFCSAVSSFQFFLFFVIQFPFFFTLYHIFLSFNTFFPLLLLLRLFLHPSFLSLLLPPLPGSFLKYLIITLFNDVPYTTKEPG